MIIRIIKKKRILSKSRYNICSAPKRIHFLIFSPFMIKEMNGKNMNGDDSVNKMQIIFSVVSMQCSIYRQVFWKLFKALKMRVPSNSMFHSYIIFICYNEFEQSFLLKLNKYRQKNMKKHICFCDSCC